MPDLEFRSAAVDDAPLLAHLNRQLIEDEGHRNAMSVAELEQRMRSWLAGEYSAVLFTIAGQPVGYALFRPEPDHVYLRQFFVDRSHRRAGLGRAATAWLRANAWSGQRIRLDVLCSNTPAQAFWRSVGFKDYCITMEAD